MRVIKVNDPCRVSNTAKTDRLATEVVTVEKVLPSSSLALALCSSSIDLVDVRT